MAENLIANVEQRTERTPDPQPMRRSAFLSCGEEAIRSPRLVSPEEWLAEGVVGNLVGVDFETYYSGDYSVQTLGTWAYCQDSRFDAYLVAVADAEKVCVCLPEEFYWETIEGMEWVSHNREFDRHVFERLVELGIVNLEVDHRRDIPGQDGPPPWKSWHCSASVCAFLQFPRDLAGAVESVFGVTLDKSVRTKASGKVMLGSIGQEDLFGNKLHSEMLVYAAKDAVACLALWFRLADKWPERERRLFELTCAMGRRGLAMDWGYVEESRRALVRKVEGLKASLPWSPALSIPKFKAACEAVGVPAPGSTAADDPGFLAWVARYGDTEAGVWARTVQEIRSANRTEKVLASMLARRRSEVGVQRPGEDGRPLVPSRCGDRRSFENRMIYELKYCGANTGRWSGGGGLNLQNLNRSEAEGVDLRRGIIASPGHVLAAVDFAQIESRVLLWLAGDHETLAMLAANPNVDVYEAHARATMGWKPECGVRNSECGVEESLKSYCARTGSTLRQLAKARVLGLGFGCGAEKFVAVARAMAGLDLSLEQAEKVVRAYRKSNPKVVGLWRRLEDAARSKVGKDYVLPLPCTQAVRGYGRFLIYRGLRLVDRELVCRVGGKDLKIYGGLLAENWTQATARDVLAEAWLRCVDAGYVPVLSVHDELVFELPETSAEADLARIVTLMEEPIAWARGLPLKAEGAMMRFYQK